MIVVPVAIAGGPPVPDSSQAEPIFDAQYEAFNAWERNTAAPGMNALANATYQNALESKARAESASASEEAAITAKTSAVASAATASVGAVTASTKAGEAAASAATAAGAAGSAVVSATSAAASAAAAAASALDAQGVVAATNAAATKETPVDADVFPFLDSAAAFGLKKFSFANFKAVLLAYLKGQFREKLTAPRIYFVRADGNDANTGLVDSAAGAFLTGQRAANVIASIDLNGYDVTVQMADGAWTSAVVFNRVLGGRVILSGNAVTPDNVFFNLAAGSCVSADNGSVVIVRNMKLQTTGISGLVASQGANINAIGVTFGACGYAHVTAQSRGEIIVSNTCKIVGSAPSFANLDNAYLNTTLVAFTLVGTPAFSTAFITAQALSYARCVLPTFSGAATGKRYSVNTGSVINVNSAGESFLPGDAAGTKATGGQYA